MTFRKGRGKERWGGRIYEGEEREEERGGEGEMRGEEG